MIEKIRKIVIDNVTGKDKEIFILIQKCIDGRKIIKAKFDNEKQCNEFIEIMKGDIE